MSRKTVWICTVALLAIGGVGVVTASAWLSTDQAMVPDVIASQINGAGTVTRCLGKEYASGGTGCTDPSKVTCGTQMYCPGLPSYYVTNNTGGSVPNGTVFCYECGITCCYAITGITLCSQ
jgi:hypothetical protein